MLWLITGGFFLLFILFTFSGILLLKRNKRNKYITAMGIGFLSMGVFILIINIVLLFDWENKYLITDKFRYNCDIFIYGN